LFKVENMDIHRIRDHHETLEICWRGDGGFIYYVNIQA